mgnify:FL=1
MSKFRYANLSLLMTKGKKKETTQSNAENKNRIHRLHIALNEKEFKVLNRFFEEYNITNKSKLIRETLMSAILKKFEEDAPTLFSEKEMR